MIYHPDQTLRQLEASAQSTDAVLVRYARLALQAQEDVSNMQREGCHPKPDDPRYTPLIGKWDGYQAPEVRFAEFAQARRDARRRFLRMTEGSQP